MRTRSKQHIFQCILGGLLAGSMILLLSSCAKSQLQRTTPFPARGHGMDPGQHAALFTGDRLSGDLDELWVLSRPEKVVAVESKIEEPGIGSLVVRQEGCTIPLPLTHTDVRASVSAYMATVDVRQEFENPFSGKIEAEYVFPLPHDAAVNEFFMTIGSRRIRGIIREREEAERIYREAKRQGHAASLLSQERPNVFRQSVANIEPGHAIDVSIRYFHTLAYADGWFEFAFPMVVGPRFNPPGFREGIGAVSDNDGASKSQPTQVAYLNPGERSGQDIALRLRIDAGVPIEAYRSPSHAVQVKADRPEVLEVELGRLDRVPNKDFAFRFQVVGREMKTGLMTHRDVKGGYFTMMLYPPEDVTSLRQHPLELVFVVDCSGSMNGAPLAQAKAAAARALRQLRPEDSFQIIRFSDRSSRLGSRPLAATPSEVQRGLEYLETLESSGGTMMIEGIKAALDFPRDPDRMRYVVFLTDGYIGNEPEIFAEVRRRLGGTRIFSFGVGSSVNRHLLEGLARMGQGAVAYLGLNESPDPVMDQFLHRVQHPYISDVGIDWGNWKVSEVHPRRMPDLYVGRPLIITGRFEGAGPGSITVSGRAKGQDVRVAVGSPDSNETIHQHSALPVVWARKQIQALADAATWNADPTIPDQIKQLALNYQLMSGFTSFVAVDSLTRTGGNDAVKVPVAVPIPEGLNHE